MRPTTIKDADSAEILHAPTLVHHTGRTGIWALLRGKGEGWGVMCACGAIGDGLDTERVAQALYLRHVGRAIDSLVAEGRSIEVV